MSYTKAAEGTQCESGDTAIHKRGLLFAGAVVKQQNGSGQKRVICVAVPGGGEPGPGGPANNRLQCSAMRPKPPTALPTEGSPSVFRAETVRWPADSKYLCLWYKGRIVERGEGFMIELHQDENALICARHAKEAAQATRNTKRGNSNTAAGKSNEERANRVGRFQVDWH